MLLATYSGHRSMQIGGKLHRVQILPASWFFIVMAKTVYSSLQANVSDIRILNFNVYSMR